MFAPNSAKVRATSSSSRGRSHEVTAISTRKVRGPLAVSMLLLLAVNIRNAWDLTLFMARKHTAAEQKQS